MLSFDTILKVHILMLIQAKVVQTGHHAACGFIGKDVKIKFC